METISSLDRRMVILGLLGVRPGSMLSAKQLARQSGISTPETRLTLKDLTARGLIEVHGGGAPHKRLFKRVGLVPSDADLVGLMKAPMPVDLNLTHKGIQTTLTTLHRTPGLPSTLVSRPGRTSTGVFPLFSYLSFRNSAEPDREALVAGVLIKQLDRDQHELTADLCGEESGTIVREFGPIRVGADGAEVLTSCMTLASQLAGCGEELASAFNEGTTANREARA